MNMYIYYMRSVCVVCMCGVWLCVWCMCVVFAVCVCIYVACGVCMGGVCVCVWCVVACVLHVWCGVFAVCDVYICTMWCVCVWYYCVCACGMRLLPYPCYHEPSNPVSPTHCSNDTRSGQSGFLEKLNKF